MNGTEASTQEGPPTWRIAVAFAVVLALAGALFVVSQASGDTAAARGDGASTPPSTEAPQIAGAQTATIVSDAEVALRAWGVFAATGELDAVEGVFAEGPQLAQLRDEAAGLLDSAPGLPAFDFALIDPAITDAGESRAVLRSAVRMTRPGTEPAEFRWDIEMRWDEAAGRWRLFTVATVQE